MTKKIIVVGLSAASVAFVTKLRSFDKSSSIICFSAEEDKPYNRCLLADLLSGEMNELDIQLKPDNFFEQLNVTVYYKTIVTSLDHLHKKIFVKDCAYDYDVLFLATGSAPFVPHLFQQSFNNCFTFHTTADIRLIDSYIAQHAVKKVAVVGAGLNGLEAASTLREKDLEVFLIERSEQILSSLVEKPVADWIVDRLTAHGIRVMNSSAVLSLDVEQNVVRTLILNNDDRLDVDMVIVVTGSQVNSQLCKNNGFEMKGDLVVVNRALQTSVPDVYAAGDLCAVPAYKKDIFIRSTTWSEAMFQGLCAATQLGEQKRDYLGYVGLTDSYFCGLPMYVCGQGYSDYDRVELVACSSDSYHVEYYKDDRLFGFVLIGDISPVARLKQQYMTMCNND